uniref:Uncharacterized protein n=1 Tax=Chromera velia CCMP2878 TaxID=1169474 RepID=A0A0K6SAU8_9ALVE|eukprot:Cvel_11045.t2-p1 / transcript=Cvel_11045.t2 / gene=Cvel_11045 / organism=Chromera_velia_CCMP2878 / gene_product=hypothetical protein / transcript_product=hypothetical protein / location=Cvel_scaffold681:27065-27316(-) / protein_length=84 / sequence_SO=supercontig / SO=protein_coding / is_pseudo=false
MQTLELAYHYDPIAAHLKGSDELKDLQRALPGCQLMFYNRSSKWEVLQVQLGEDGERSEGGGGKGEGKEVENLGKAHCCKCVIM